MTLSAVVLDIEGTTSSLSSVHDRLFGYARPRYGEWLRRPELASLADELRSLAGRPSAGVDELAAIVRQWADEHSKVPALKAVQAAIWHHGFVAGELRGHVYPDVPGALASWTAGGLTMYVYSSGSVSAQRDWFAHTDRGDLSGYFSGHFDTRSPGVKTSPDSYLAIASSALLPASSLAFLSDSRAELDAAATAGLRVLGVSRPEDGSPDVGGHPAVSSLAEVSTAAALAERVSAPARSVGGSR